MCKVPLFDARDWRLEARDGLRDGTREIEVDSENVESGGAADSCMSEI